MRHLRNAWQRNYCGLKDLSADYIHKKLQGAKSSRGAVGSKREDELGTDQLPDTFSVSSSESSLSEDYEPRSKKKKQELSVSLSSFVGNALGVAMAAFLRENDESPMDTFKSIGRLFESTNKNISVKPVLTNDKNEPVSPETSRQTLETKENRKRESEEEEHHDIEEQESLKNCFEQCDDEGHDIFEQLGTSAKTIGMMTSSKIPKTGLFHASSWKEIINVNLSSDVLMNEIEDNCEYRRFNDKGMATIMSILEKTNPHCCLAIKKNRIKKVGSRKINIRFWSGRAVCTFTTCKCFAELNIQNRQNPVLEIIWKNNISHNIAEMKKRKLTGQKRSNFHTKFKANDTAPSKTLRQRLASLSSESYSSGKREVTQTTLSQIKYDASQQSSSEDLLTNLKDLRRKIKDEDETQAVII